MFFPIHCFIYPPFAFSSLHVYSPEALDPNKEHRMLDLVTVGLVFDVLKHVDLMWSWSGSPLNCVTPEDWYEPWREKKLSLSELVHFSYIKQLSMFSKALTGKLHCSPEIWLWKLSAGKGHECLTARQWVSFLEVKLFCCGFMLLTSAYIRNIFQ